MEEVVEFERRGVTPDSSERRDASVEIVEARGRWRRRETRVQHVLVESVGKRSSRRGAVGEKSRRDSIS